jgi:putative addiction module component (TIGR02574 family)
MGKTAMTNPTYESVLQDALRLSWDDRNKLSQTLWDSLHPPNPLSEEEIHALLAERIRDVDEGRAKLIPRDQAWRKILDEE